MNKPDDKITKVKICFCCGKEFETDNEICPTCDLLKKIRARKTPFYHPPSSVVLHPETLKYIKEHWNCYKEDD